MKRILSVKNGILIEETPMFPADFGKKQAKKDLKEFKEKLIDAFNSDDDVVFEKRTREALERVESRDEKGMSKSEFLEELDSW